MSEDPRTQLSDELQRRGRRLAVLSHPFGMIFREVNVRDLATQALVTLGAGEALVGVQASLGPFANLLQLVGLRGMGRFGKRRLLLVTQVLALLGGLPLLWFDDLRSLEPGRAVPLALASLLVVTVTLIVGSTAWWPLLHGFLRPERTSRFFGVLRTVWHLALIAFFLGSTWWLAQHPGAFGPLFLGAWLCGAVRIALLPFFPERNEPAQARVRETLRLLWRTPPLRRYMIGVTLDMVVLRSLAPFTIVLLRREIGLGESATLSLTLAFFVGGLLALYPAGRLADRFGARPVLVVACLLRGLLIAGMAGAVLLPEPRHVLWVVTALYFTYSLLTAGFGVAEIKVLFANAPGDAPSTLIVLAVVIRNVAAGFAPLLSGAALQLLQGTEATTLSLYQGFFVLAALLQIGALLPFVRRP